MGACVYVVAVRGSKVSLSLKRHDRWDWRPPAPSLIPEYTLYLPAPATPRTPAHTCPHLMSAQRPSPQTVSW